MAKEGNGFFLTIEGCEGTGKSTLGEKLYSYLTNVEDLEVVKTFEPGGTAFGKRIRQILLNENDVEISSRSELLLFLADRAHHVETIIKPALADGKIVICDRFTDSSIAYQGAARKISNSENLEDLCLFATGNLVPDLTLYLDIDPKVGLSRLKSEKDRLEKEDIAFHQKVREGYLHLANENPDRIYIIDAEKDPDTVFQTALSKLLDVMKEYVKAIKASH